MHYHISFIMLVKNQVLSDQAKLKIKPKYEKMLLKMIFDNFTVKS